MYTDIDRGILIIHLLDREPVDLPSLLAKPHARSLMKEAGASKRP